MLSGIEGMEGKHGSIDETLKIHDCHCLYSKVASEFDIAYGPLHLGCLGSTAYPNIHKKYIVREDLMEF